MCGRKEASGKPFPSFPSVNVRENSLTSFIIDRLKMSFVNVGSPTGGQSPNSGSAPVLASCFSQPFQVFSAKKFPGVIESTPLSKCFATQGIKIPIRKDVPRGNIREDDEDGS